MKVALVADIGKPSVNGLMTFVANVVPLMRAHTFYHIHPRQFRSLYCPWYPDVRLFAQPSQFGQVMARFRPDTLHIASEGPMGLMARLWATHHRVQFSSAVHTRMDIHLQTNLHVPQRLVNRYMRWFHAASANVLVNTPSHLCLLRQQGFQKMHQWHLGVDMQRFRPAPHGNASPRPYLLYVGRLSREKNILAFLQMPHKLRKVVVGGGPELPSLRARYPEVEFRGMLFGDELIAAYAHASAMVFPSRSETLGMVVLESMACGTPVASYPVMGPRDLISNGINGWYADDLATATEHALAVSRQTTRASVFARTWRQTADEFAQALRTPRPLVWRHGKPGH